MAGSTLEKLAHRAAKQSPVTVDQEIYIPLEKIEFDPKQPRSAFHQIDQRVSEEDEQGIADLAKTIQSQGLEQAITVELLENGNYKVKYGERRTRAHLLLGEKVIRARVENKVQTSAERLISQLVENVARQDLSDADLARSVRALREGVDGSPPLNQTQIADLLGKSEGWVTRFIKFGDDDIQRVWVVPNIADTPEKAYRISLLPVPMQLDILRRVDLPEGDPDRLEKPLLRNVIDALALEAKSAKREQPKKESLPPAASLVDTPATARTSSTEESNTGVQSDAIAAALQEAADHYSSGQHDSGSGDAEDSASNTDGGKYALSPEARAALLGGAQEAMSTAGGGTEVIEPPVNCHLSVRNLEALLEILREDTGSLDSMRRLRCNVSIPGSLSKTIANRLSGVVVPEQQVPAVVQNELTKLG